MKQNQRNIVHIMAKSRLKSDIFYYEVEIFKNMYQQHNLWNIIFYKWSEFTDEEFIQDMQDSWVILISYTTKKSLLEQLKKIQKYSTTIFVNTTSELLISMSNSIKKELWQKISWNPKMFRDKFLQRKLLQQNGGTNGIRFICATLKELKYEEIKKEVWIPCILKPTNGLQSSWVVKINNKKDFTDYKYHFHNFHENCHNRWFESSMIIAEEFIDGKLYSIDYFVDENANCIISQPVLVETWKDLNIDDYFNACMHASQKVEREVDRVLLEKFIRECVQATDIKNTFVHHEFKVTEKWDFKTIEFNGRIWWWRVELMKESYNINLYNYILGKKQKKSQLENNFIKINIYSPTKGILTSYNEELLQRVKHKRSVYEVEYHRNMLGKNVWLTKDGFTKIITIKMKHPDIKIIEKDMNYIKRHYESFLRVEDETKFTEVITYIRTLGYNFSPRWKKKNI